ncbi:MAG TPA: amino acid ABC transporter permease [Candidatus Dependentiae bacterium]|nr:amino acid ABC transporter permease [Candidatus Dependentiae bacterium]HRQ62902.1 amino acid ABC transporter permease [Candidatus Dependentiae bacterium]
MINIIVLKHTLFNLLYGATISIQITLFALIIGIMGGTLLALLLSYGNTFIRTLGHIYITIVRGTPMLVQIIALFYVLPSMGIMLSAFWSATITIGCNSIAYVSQIMRTGIQAVGHGQLEAAQTLGFSTYQIIRYIVLPQAFRTIFPALGNECITLIKDSSLASVIGVAELTHQGSIIMSKTYDALTTYAGVGLIYLCITSIISLFLHIMEQRLHYAKY